MVIQDYIALATSVFTLLSVVFVGWQVRKMAQSTSLSRLQNQHLLCLEVWKQFNDVFIERQEILQNPIHFDSLLLQCPTVKDIVNSSEYARLKRVAGVYVLAGALVHSNAIAATAIYQYISVPKQMWNDHWPLIEYLRANYYPNLWWHWEFLVALPENEWTIGDKHGPDRRASPTFPSS